MTIALCLNDIRKTVKAGDVVVVLSRKGSCRFGDSSSRGLAIRSGRLVLAVGIVHDTEQPYIFHSRKGAVLYGARPDRIYKVGGATEGAMEEAAAKERNGLVPKPKDVVSLTKSSFKVAYKADLDITYTLRCAGQVGGRFHRPAGSGGNAITVADRKTDFRNPVVICRTFAMFPGFGEEGATLSVPPDFLKTVKLSRRGVTSVVLDDGSAGKKSARMQVEGWLRGGASLRPHAAPATSISNHGLVLEYIIHKLSCVFFHFQWFFQIRLKSISFIRNLRHFRTDFSIYSQMYNI